MYYGNYNNTYLGNYNNPYNNMQGQLQPYSNKIYVTSAEDALSRVATFNTSMTYFLQDDSMIFEVYTDMQGRKTIKARKVVDFEPTKSMSEPSKSKKKEYVTRAEFEEFKANFTPKKEIEEDDIE